jgi:hypothetical protein
MKEIFWDIWEFVCSDYSDIADEYCKDDEYLFSQFRNEIQAKSDLEIAELIAEIIEKIKQKLTL